MHRRCSRQQGLTLIELLVALTLMSIIMLGLVQAMRSIGQTENRIDDRLARNDHIRVTHSFLQSVLSRVDATLYKRGDGHRSDVMLFEHAGDSLQWVGIMPGRPGTGGRYFMRLAPEELADGKRGLVFRYAPWSPGGAFPAWEAASSHVLLSGLAALEIAAQGLPRDLGDLRGDWPQDFQARWHAPKETPQRISIAVRDQQGPWPVVMVQVLPTQVSTPLSGGFVTGGGSR
jgi:general secretion pathway protein J